MELAEDLKKIASTDRELNGMEAQENGATLNAADASKMKKIVSFHGQQPDQEASIATVTTTKGETPKSITSERKRRRSSTQGLVIIEQCIEGFSSSRDFAPESSTHLRMLEELDPPLSGRERRRDALLNAMANSKFILYANCLVLFLVVAVGALWFFFLMGWQTLCRPRTDCEPRNTVYNISIHIMTVLFTYMSTIVMPWRWAHTLHTLGLSCPRRSNATGHDLYGLPTDDPWFHVPRNKRCVILFFLQLNCFFQYANQICRDLFYTYDQGEEWPGNFWVNIFFVLSLAWAVIGALLFWKHTSIVRQSDKKRFGLGPIELMQEMWEKFKSGNRLGTTSRGEEEEEIQNQEETQQKDDSRENGQNLSYDRES
ncbi:hypothetical protein ACA910_022267 [Epithemia clementina (nom. ined.)]